jgi:hypothetical protein
MQSAFSGRQCESIKDYHLGVGEKIGFSPSGHQGFDPTTLLNGLGQVFACAFVYGRGRHDGFWPVDQGL